MTKHLAISNLLKRRVLSLSIIFHLVVTTNCFCQSVFPSARIPSSLLLASEINDCVALGGVKIFETWFETLEKGFWKSSVSHTAFGSLRGLTCSENINEENKNILNVPGDIVLSASYANEDWDVELAQKLWRECMKGSESSLSGYCSLLSYGEKFQADTVPPRAAPNALRHWTKEELDGLSLSPNGKKLVALKETQDKQWRRKFESLPTDCQMSWEQFEWCLEVIHSRAFRGNFAQSSLRGIASAAAPLLSAGLGWLYVNGNPDYSDAILLTLAAIASSPLIANTISPDKGEVVLLPLIDSANHLQEADSKIEFDPLGGVFSLTVGPKCLVQDREGGKPELCISYGPKTDNELLLNYGFLPGVCCENEEEGVQREIMALEYLKRNV